MSMAERDETMDEFIETALAVFEGEYCGRCAKRGEGVFCDRAKFQTAGAGYTSRVHCTAYQSTVERW